MVVGFRYPELKRKNYAKVSDKDVSALREILSGDAERVVIDADVLVQHSCDWLKTLRGKPASCLHIRSL
jgi:hypothetical protein